MVSPSALLMVMVRSSEPRANRFYNSQVTGVNKNKYYLFAPGSTQNPFCMFTKHLNFPTANSHHIYITKVHQTEATVCFNVASFNMMSFHLFWLQH